MLHSPNDEVVRIRVLRASESEKFPEGIKYAFPYDQKGGEDPIFQHDNHHGVHERHCGSELEEIDFSGAETLLRRFVRELPDHVSP